ncbi:MAG TPA: VOC family protein [Acidimicrobiales bacterium]|nr:VOC family protein [Acidimicrobiales bacterium]
MPEMTRYEHGVPSWVDMGAPDYEAALSFYTDLFGWESQDMGEEAGHYHMVSKGGRLVAGIGPAQDPGPPRWTMYVNVDDVDSIAKAVEAAGGRVLMAPMDVMSAGRMVVLADTTGAVSSAWQAKDHTGAQLVNEPGTFTWSELHTRDVEKSKQFYSEVYGWGWGGAPEYAEAQVSGRSMAGVMARRPEMPAEVPDNWLIYFGSADVDADAQRATSLGATEIVPPTDVPNMGRFAVFIDPQGASFALYKA